MAPDLIQIDGSGGQAYVPFVHLTRRQQRFGRRLTAIVVAGIAAAALTSAPSPVGAYTPPPTVQWETLFPGVPTLLNPQFTGAPGCETATMACIDYEIAQLDAIRVHYGCDHRAVFATTYELLTMQLKHDIEADPHLFNDLSWLIGEDVTFANLYFDAVRRYEQGQPVPRAWQLAFDTATRGDANAVQDMLLGINAHVQRDMPFMMAAVGLHAPDGTSRKPDHDVLNDILNRAYQKVTDEIARRFDPIEGFIAPGTNLLLGYVGNVTGDQLVQLWREVVWRNAEAMLNAKDAAQLAKVKAGIEGNASSWASAIRSFQVPNYRAFRDKYCALHNVGPLTL